jgi:type IV pilus assembly protein PilO
MAIDINTIKKLDPKIKALIVFLAFLLIGYLYWFTFLSAEFETKSSLSTQLSEMQAKIKEQEKIAVQLKKYITDVAALQASYKIALQKLPDQREIPSLFHSVASAGKDAGIEFLSFEPKASVPKAMDTTSEAPKVSALLKPSDQRDQKPEAAAPAKGKKGAVGPQPEPFYEEIPVAISVMGSYQDILYFFDKVAKLPRIVNISDITMSDAKVKGKGKGITSTFIIKTYMFIEKKEKTSEKIK